MAGDIPAIPNTIKGVVAAAESFHTADSAGGETLTPGELRQVYDAAMRLPGNGYYRAMSAVKDAGFLELSENMISGSYEGYFNDKWAKSGSRDKAALGGGTNLGEFETGMSDTALTVKGSGSRVFPADQLDTARRFAAASAMREGQDMAIMRTERGIIAIPIEATGLDPSTVAELDMDELDPPEGYEVLSILVGSESGVGEWINPESRAGPNNEHLLQLLFHYAV